MQKQPNSIPLVENCTCFFPRSNPHRPHHLPNTRKHITPNSKPRRIKQHRNQIDPHLKQGENINHRNFEFMLVKHPPRYEKPSVRFHAQTRSHEPSVPGVSIRYDQIQQCRNVMLYYYAWRLNAARDQRYPNEVGDEVPSRYCVE